MRIHRLDGLGMLGPLLAPAIDDRAYDNRHTHLPPEQIRPIGRLVYNRIDCQKHEIHSRMKHNRPHADNRGADGSTRRRIFRDRTVNDSLTAELFIQIQKTFSRIPGVPDALPADKDPRIMPQELSMGLSYRLCVGESAHPVTTLSVKRRHV